ncbi:MAG: AbrB/MazE/SpoVT family DNA-binding domain-containing protein [Candidatus Sabulitectum sp.]|nr:AbrB/MazE/SpoVT family DNA-binding domain-containing protein [Candidatus Sabulitectum sp.]
MHVTAKGQVTIPKNIREELGIKPETDIDFREDNGKFYIVRISKPKITGKFNKLRGIATAKMTTDEIMSLTRG